MPKPFEITKEIVAPVPAEDVWLALTTGDGMDGWFLGTGNEIEGRQGGRVHLDFGEGGSADSTITAWEPPHRFAFGGEVGPDGVSHAFEYTLEGREGGRTWIRLVHSGFLGDDWEAEYEALGEGDGMYLHLLAQYATWFPGRRASLVSAFRPETGTREHAMQRFQRALGMSGAPAIDERVRFEVEGLPPIEGVVDFTSRSIIGIRTHDALLRFLYTPQGMVFAGHHLYRDGDGPAAEGAWRAWLDRTFA